MAMDKPAVAFDHQNNCVYLDILKSESKSKAFRCYCTLIPLPSYQLPLRFPFHLEDEYDPRLRIWSCTSCSESSLEWEVSYSPTLPRCQKHESSAIWTELMLLLPRCSSSTVASGKNCHLFIFGFPRDTAMKKTLFTLQSLLSSQLQ